MDIKQVGKPFVIGYGGGLNYFDGNHSRNFLMNKLKGWFFTYHIDNINGETRSGYYLFRLIKHLVDQKIINSSDVQINLWGLIEKENEEQVRSMGIDHIVKISGYLNRKESVAKLKECDVLFLPLESAKNAQRPLFIPGKLFEYLSLGKPILAFADDSDVKNILEKSVLATIASPFDMRECQEKLLFLLSNRHKLSSLFIKNESYVKENFDFDNLTKRLAEVFDKL